jgi:hypothetical protein
MKKAKDRVQKANGKKEDGFQHGFRLSLMPFEVLPFAFSASR